MNFCEKCQTQPRCERRLKCYDNRMPVELIVLASPGPMSVKTVRGEGMTGIVEKAMNYTKKKPAKKGAKKKASKK